MQLGATIGSGDIVIGTSFVLCIGTAKQILETLTEWNKTFIAVVSKLEDSDLIKSFYCGVEVPAPNASDLICLSENVVNIFVDNNSLCYRVCYRNKDDDIIICLYVDTSVTDTGYWLSAFLLGLYF